jgi:cell division protein FtsQ
LATQRKHQSKPRKERNLGRLYLLISAIVILAVIAFASIVFFKVNQIQVVGNVHYTEEEVIEAAGVRTGDNLVLTRNSTVVARLLNELPYVNSVSIQKTLPDTLTITVVESNAQAAIYDGNGSWWLMDTSGKLLEQLKTNSQEEPTEGEAESSSAGATPEEGAEASSSGVTPEEESVPMPDPPEGYPIVTGLTLRSPFKGSVIALEEDATVSEKLMLDSLLGLLPALQNHELLGQVDSIDLSGESEIVLEYAGRLTIKLLQDMDYDYQVKEIQGVLNYVDTSWSAEDTGVLDMTFANGNPRLKKSER